MSPRTRRWPLLLLLCTAAFSGLLLWWARQPRDPTHTLSAVITAPAPDLGPRAHVLLPHLQDAVVVVPDRPHDPSEVQAADRLSRIQRTRSFRVTTNSLALRSPEVAAPKDGPRILCLGDSVTFGWGVADEETYPALLQDLLRVEVVNAGVPAMKPSSIAKWAQQHAAALDPDLVLLARRPDHSSPDPWRDYQQALQILRGSIGDARLGILLPPVSTFDPRGVAALREEGQRIQQLAQPSPVLDLTDAFRAALPLPGVVLQQEGGQQRMVRLPDGAILVEATAPPLAPGQPALATAITDAFEDNPSLQEPLFFDGGHPDREGFVLFAREVAAWIQRENLL